jgi:hypothetical protein
MAIAGIPGEYIIDPRGVPLTRSSTVALPTPLVLPPKPVYAPVQALGVRKMPQTTWTHTVEASPALPMPVQVNYWTEGLTRKLDRECVVIKGFARGRSKGPATTPVLEVRAEITAAFDPLRGVNVTSASETWLSRIWPIGSKGPTRRITRVTTFSAELLGAAPWPAGTPPGSPLTTPRRLR